MRHRRDLVMAMSVAEIFLLLLFVIWVTSQAKEGPLDIEQLQDKVTKLEATVKIHEETIRDLEAWKSAYEAFIESLGQPKPKTVKELIERTERNGNGNGGDDLPKCSPSGNRLITARVTDGVSRITIVNDYATFPYRVGQVFEGDEINQVILAAVRIQDANRCRFHYRLEFASASDYLLGRRRFGTVFYPDGEIQVQTR
jgi:hypothetical protein